jgi:hypothetical protein
MCFFHLFQQYKQIFDVFKEKNQYQMKEKEIL